MSELVQLDGQQPRTEPTSMHVEQAVRERYSAASREREASLCCPVQYDGRYLAILPDELIERDYGCGDPSRYVREGDRVLDLGSGGGKICYIASQIVGSAGRVIGVDMNDDMLALARRHRQTIAERIGWDNVAFHKGRIQDLALDLERFEGWLTEHPIHDANGWLQAQQQADLMRLQSPMIADGSVDVVLSNCVLNLVSPGDRQMLFDELFRTLAPGGRAVISDIVCDEVVPQRLRDDPELWSGCISGAFVEDEFLNAFMVAGFEGIEIVSRQAEPWATIEGIEFRSMTVRAWKPVDDEPLDLNQAVVYRGPWAAVVDEDGNLIPRGERTAVSSVDARRFAREPYAEQLVLIEPHTPVDPATAESFRGEHHGTRSLTETKGQDFRLTRLPGGSCCGGSGDGSSCC